MQSTRCSLLLLRTAIARGRRCVARLQGVAGGVPGPWLDRLRLVTVLAALPVGIYQGDPDSTVARIGLHAGIGRTFTVARDCSNNVVALNPADFADVSGEAHVALPPGKDSPFVIGMIGGYFQAPHVAPAVADSSGSGGFTFPEVNVDFWMFNPSIAYERGHFGCGLGVVIGDVPMSLNDALSFSVDPSNEQSDLPVTGHLRVGSVAGIYGMAALGESLPLVSGGGLFTLGLGYPISTRIHAFTGMSGAFYEGVGVVQDLRLGTGARFELQFSGRIAGVAGQAEPAGSLGLTWRLGGRPH